MPTKIKEKPPGEKRSKEEKSRETEGGGRRVGTGRKVRREKRQAKATLREERKDKKEARREKTDEPGEKEARYSKRMERLDGEAKKDWPENGGRTTMKDECTKRGGTPAHTDRIGCVSTESGGE
ncbi:hypothetical protein Tco_1178073 [Tanacetum coccineum]